MRADLARLKLQQAQAAVAAACTQVGFRDRHQRCHERMNGVLMQSCRIMHISDCSYALWMMQRAQRPRLAVLLSKVIFEYASMWKIVGSRSSAFRCYNAASDHVMGGVL